MLEVEVMVMVVKMVVKMVVIVMEVSILELTEVYNTVGPQMMDLHKLMEYDLPEAGSLSATAIL